MRSAFHKFKTRRSSTKSDASVQAEDPETASEVASSIVAIEALTLNGSLHDHAVEEEQHVTSAVASPPALLSPLSSTASTVPVVLAPAIIENVRSGSVHAFSIEQVEQPEANIELRAPSASDSAAQHIRIESAIAADVVAATAKPLGGTNVPAAAAGDTATDHSWSALHADYFMIRNGPNYKKASMQQ